MSGCKINEHKIKPRCNVTQQCTVKLHVSRTVVPCIPTELFMYHPTVKTCRRHGNMALKFIVTALPQCDSRNDCKYVNHMLHSANYTDTTQTASWMKCRSINGNLLHSSLPNFTLRLYKANQNGFELLTKHFPEVYEQTQKPKFVWATNMQCSQYLNAQKWINSISAATDFNTL
jgi:hypothetical protein